MVGAKLISQLVRPAATYATALTTFDRSLAGVGASGKAKSDVSALIAADNVVIGDLHALSGTTAAQFSSWGQKLLSDGATAVAAGDTFGRISDSHQALDEDLGEHHRSVFLR